VNADEARNSKSVSLARTFSTPAGTTTSWPGKRADTAARLRAKVAVPDDGEPPAEPTDPSDAAGCGIRGAGSQFSLIALASPSGSGMSWLVVPESDFSDGCRSSTSTAVAEAPEIPAFDCFVCVLMCQV
jgi:hypothetical protein